MRHDICHALDMTFVMTTGSQYCSNHAKFMTTYFVLIFRAVGGKFHDMNETSLKDSNKHLREQIAELQTLLAEVKPLLVAAEVELSERLAAISAFEFRVRSRLEPLTRRMDQLDEEILELREQLRQLQEDMYDADDFRIEGLYRFWRSSAEAGAAASGTYRYRKAPTSPPPQKLSADDTAELKRLYRQLARRFHPDFALDDEDRAYRTDIMMAINVAYAMGDLLRLEELALEPDSRPQIFTDQDMADALLKELYRCQRRIEEIGLELSGLEEHPSAELMRRAGEIAEEGRDLLDELASELRERIAGKMIRRDVLQEEIKSFSNGELGFGGEDLADMVYDLGLEQTFDEDPMTGVSEWRDKNRERIDFDDIPDESTWDELRKMRNRQQK